MGGRFRGSARFKANGERVTRIEAQRQGGKWVIGANSWGTRYVSMSQRQQQHKAVQQAVRHASPVSSLLLSSTTYTGERKGEINAGGNNNR